MTAVAWGFLFWIAMVCGLYVAIVMFIRGWLRGDF